jgi:predicted nucleic acid-binding protein
MIVGKSSLFVDTSGWIEVFGKNNPFHEKAINLLARAMRERRLLITTNYVITEFVGRGGKACRLTRQELLKAVDEISKLPRVEVVHIGEESHAFAITFLRGRLDKDWAWLMQPALMLCVSVESERHLLPILILYRQVLSNCFNVSSHLIFEG